MEEHLEKERLPRHVAVIMDGNGRWAEGRSLSRPQGHVEGVRRVEEIVDESVRLGIEALTLFTFSTENWSRPDKEVSVLMNILSTVLHHKIKKLKRDNIRFVMIGRPERLPKVLLRVIDMVKEETKDNTGMILNLAFNYGSRSEIIDAVKSITRRVQDGEIDVDDISDQMLSDSLYTKGQPDPDLLIRTSGEKRISNFLLWQLSYAELYFTDKYWPDFTIEEYHKALKDFQRRNRRFGNINNVENV